MNDAELPERRSETMNIVLTVVGSLNEVIAALRGEIAAFTKKDEDNRKRLDLKLALIGVAVLLSAIGVGINYGQGNDVKSIVNYIQDCQKPESECKKRNDAVIGGAVKSISGSVFDATACVQALPLAERTDAVVKACRDKYIPQ